MPTSPRLLIPLAVFSLAACGDGGADGGDGDGQGAGGGVGTGDPTAALTVYAHTASALYTIDPDTLAAEMVGPFTFDMGGGQVTDLAIDREGRMIANTFTDVFYVDARDASCRWLAGLGASYNGMTFVPAGQIDGIDDEILVGVTTTGQVTRIDPLTGTSTPIGAYGGGLASSGDVVSVIGLGTLATVTGGAGPGDTLAEIDPTTGVATAIGGTSATEVWGLAFWDTSLYGFSAGGSMFRIDPATGATSDIVSGTDSWWGAAVTTSAPVNL